MELLNFESLPLPDPLLKGIRDAEFKTCTPIQSKSLPITLARKDLAGQAQTGTGKTAAFALPLLSRLDLKVKNPQLLVLAPTRELAIQVSEAFQNYASKMKGFRVVPIYGGQDYRQQLRALDRGVHVVVGTPGRVMDHMRRKSLNLTSLQAIVLDEADEMLRMGFIDDVEWVLEQLPKDHQTALFSATMPKQISKIAQRYLNKPELVSIKGETATVKSVRQRFWMVSGLHKLEALTRILEVEETDGIIIFARTKIATTELADKLLARGFAAAPLNGDITQKAREQTVNKLKNGSLDVLVATDVAARGLDVPRISHVINYDISYDTESYIHRIGRTGRAGRKGDAILFVAPREKRMLYAIEKATKQKIEEMKLPSYEVINKYRVSRFKQQISDTLLQLDLSDVDETKSEGLNFYRKVVEEYQSDNDISVIDIAAALASLAQGDRPLLLKQDKSKKRNSREDRADRSDRGRGNGRERGERNQRGDRNQRDGRNKRGDSHRKGERTQDKRDDSSKRKSPERKVEKLAPGLERFRIAVGNEHNIKADKIVEAVSNEAGLFVEDIGKVEIYDNHSTIVLPQGMPRDIFRALRKTWVSGHKLDIERIDSGGTQPPKKKRKGDGRDRK